MKEAIADCERITGKKMNFSYSETNRIGDHIWYISDLRKFKNHYPDWNWTFGIEDILMQIHESMSARV
jgi:CDP-paratose 2-epimerase